MAKKSARIKWQDYTIRTVPGGILDLGPSDLDFNAATFEEAIQYLARPLSKRLAARGFKHCPVYGEGDWRRLVQDETGSRAEKPNEETEPIETLSRQSLINLGRVRRDILKGETDSALKFALWAGYHMGTANVLRGLEGSSRRGKNAGAGKARSKHAKLVRRAKAVFSQWKRGKPTVAEIFLNLKAKRRALGYKQGTVENILYANGFKEWS